MRKFGKHGVCIEFPKDLQQIDLCCQYINSGKIKELILETDDNEYELDFIYRLVCPECVKELSVYGNFTDIVALYSFTEINKLYISCRNYRDVDLSNYPKLKELSASGIKPYSFKDTGVPPIEKLVLTDCEFNGEIVAQMQRLKVISAHNVKKINIVGLSHNPNLERLHLVQCNIRDLIGIESLPMLKVLSLSYCRSLENIYGLAKVKTLIQVQIVSCPKLVDLSELSKIRFLRTVILENIKKCKLDFLWNMASADNIRCMMLENCGTIPSISFLDNYAKLQAFCGYDTNIKDGDLTPLLRLESARVSQKRHYNVKEKDLPFGNVFMHWWAETQDKLD